MEVNRYSVNKGDIKLEVKINKSLVEREDTSTISLTDLMLNKEFAEKVESSGIEECGELLHSIGVDLEYGVDWINRLHRPLSSKEPRYGYMLLYKERLDKEWIKSGYASMEAIIASTEDLDTRRELNRMQDCYLTTGKVIDHCEKGLSMIDPNNISSGSYV